MKNSRSLVPFFEGRNRQFYKYPMSVMPYVILSEGFNDYKFENTGKYPNYFMDERKRWITGMEADRESGFYELIVSKFIDESFDNLLQAILLKHGIFNYRYFEAGIRSHVVKLYAENQVDVDQVRTLLNELKQRSEWRDKPRGYYITKDSNAIYILLEHVYEQTLLRIMPEIVDGEPHLAGLYNNLEHWYLEHAIYRDCVLCGRRFRVIDIPYNYYFGSDGFKNCCFSCPLTQLPSKTELQSLLPIFVDACGFIPDSNIGPIKYSFTSRLDDDKKADVFYSYAQMGGIDHIRAHFGSWFEALVKSGVLPEGVLQTARGIRCLAKDDHICHSLDEQLIDNWLTQHGIPHEREPLYPYHSDFNKNGRKRADWKVGNTYIEYFGLTGDEDYDKKTIEKILLANCMDLDILPVYPSDIGRLNEKFASLETS